MPRRGTPRVRESRVILSWILGGLACLSFVLMLWQWALACRFPLHQRAGDRAFAPGVTLLKPLKGCDHATESCLRSWLEQDYPGEVQVLFAVASPDDPVCAVVQRLLADFPGRDARLVICRDLRGPNLKVAKLAELAGLARHAIFVVSDADVRVPSDFLVNLASPLKDPGVGMVNCFYRLVDSVTAAMRWEAVGVNADFWSQVLQAQSLKPLDFALGAVMGVRRECVEAIGGFWALREVLADDYQLGRRVAAGGRRIALCPVVVECRSGPMGWRQVWRHQLRWARTIRVCQPIPYFFSLLGNVTLWAFLWAGLAPGPCSAGAAAFFVASRWLFASRMQRRFGARPCGGQDGPASVPGWYLPLRDLLQFAVWLTAFCGSTIEWRGEVMRLRSDGTLDPARQG